MNGGGDVIYALIISNQQQFLSGLSLDFSITAVNKKDWDMSGLDFRAEKKKQVLDPIGSFER